MEKWTVSRFVEYVSFHSIQFQPQCIAVAFKVGQWEIKLRKCRRPFFKRLLRLPTRTPNYL